MSGELWDVRQCAAYVGVRPQTWSTYASRGIAPHPVARGQWDAEEVETWARPRIPAPDPAIPSGAYGAADGCGRYGILDAAEDGRLICHECGRGVWHLTSHLHTAHQQQPDTYRVAHGLSLTIPLVATPVLERLEEAWQEHAGQHLRDLDTHRDPGRAAAASRERPPVSALSRARMHHPRGRALTPDEVDRLATAPSLGEWARIARDLLDDGASGSTISAATGILRTTVHARIRRFVPRT